jgi:hypothetical protein
MHWFSLTYCCQCLQHYVALFLAVCDFSSVGASSANPPEIPPLNSSPFSLAAIFDYDVQIYIDLRRI